jgi:hypothetical protein
MERITVLAIGSVLEAQYGAGSAWREARKADL